MCAAPNAGSIDNRTKASNSPDFDIMTGVWRMNIPAMRPGPANMALESHRLRIGRPDTMPASRACDGPHMPARIAGFAVIVQGRTHSRRILR